MIRFDDGVHVNTFERRMGDGKLAGHDQDGNELKLRRVPVVPPEATGHPFLPLSELARTWVEQSGTTLVLAPNGLLAYGNKPLGIWQDKADAVVLTFQDGRIDSYTKFAGNTLTGSSSTGHAVAIRKLPGR